MFGIIANSLKVATRVEQNWDAPDHWSSYDHRTSAERKRDQADRRRWLRHTGIL
ncbi:hypothetical protein [Gymnodinialimonas ulvae]|uniref:hypothetical protein n=1 Tax=Gymnodinialimonas ulvae TaxID=3126504 RepID=UPI00309B9841